MKILLIIITFLVSNEIDQQEAAIYGHWKLIKIEVNQEVLRPEEQDYFLTITKDLFSYNLEVNKCQTKDFTITNHEINLDSVLCTLICCDGRFDSISNFINYRGAYEVNQNQLIITTSNSKLILERLLD